MKCATFHVFGIFSVYWHLCLQKMMSSFYVFFFLERKHRQKLTSVSSREGCTTFIWQCPTLWNVWEEEVIISFQTNLKINLKMISFNLLFFKIYFELVSNILFYCIRNFSIPINVSIYVKYSAYFDIYQWNTLIVSSIQAKFQVIPTIDSNFTVFS